MSDNAHNIAPRVATYPVGSTPAVAEPGWITLAQLVPAPGSSVVFGDGSHPTTRLCAAALDSLCRRRQPERRDAGQPERSEGNPEKRQRRDSGRDAGQPESVLDVGTGTGVLARIARARGARFIVGTDIDPAALSCARAHSDLDAHPVEILLSPEAPDHWGARFDLVVANILEAPLRALAPALRGALRPGGLLLISGFTRPQTPALRVLYENAGLTLLGQSSLDGWSLLTFVL